MIFLGLGSNIGDRYLNLKNGIQVLQNHPHIWITNISHVYESPEYYHTGQRDFYNMVIKIETNLTPLDLLKAVKIVETKIGRKPKSKNNMPRILDIDILAIGGLEIHSHILEVPHPCILERKFVLKPWRDVDPKYCLPNHTKTIAQLLDEIEDTSPVRMVLILD